MPGEKSIRRVERHHMREPAPNVVVGAGVLQKPRDDLR
jgi:hypothetical protein